MNTLLPMLAAISGEGMVRQLLVVLIIGICVLIVWYMGKWVITKLGALPIVMTVWNGLFILLGGIVIINFLLGMVDRPLIRW
jgi:hypothetical protein